MRRNLSRKQRKKLKAQRGFKWVSFVRATNQSEGKSIVIVKGNFIPK